MDYVLDCETLGTESPSIILSIALLPFSDADINTPFFDLVNRVRVWKLSVKSQHNRKRTHDPKTIQWWGKQSHEAKTTSFKPRFDDLDPSIALSQITQLVDKENDTFWSRGLMDQLWLQSLCRTYEIEYVGPEEHYDIRTARQCQGKDKNHTTRPDGFIAHDPRHDCAIDVLGLISPAP